MSKVTKAQIVNVFTSNIGGYVGYGDIQEVITGLTFLYWNAKFVIKKPVPQTTDQNVLDSYLQSVNDENKDLIWNVCNTIRGCMVESNLSNIFNFLNDFNEKEIIEIICNDYSSSSRYNSSTPESIISLVYKILENNGDKEFNEVIDICSYTGNFLSYYAQQQPNNKYSGVEINNHSSLISELKLIALGVEHDIKTRNVLRINLAKKYDKVFCNQPFNIRLEPEDYECANKNNRIVEEEFNKRITSDWIFVSEVINSLNETGKGAIIVPNGCLYKLPDANIRRELVEKGYIECVISLPGNLFNNTMIPTTLLILSKNNKTIKFIDASKLFVKEVPTNKLEVEKIYNEYCNSQNNDITKIVDINKVGNEYNLSVECYMDIEEIEINNPKKLVEISEDIFRGYQITSREIDQYSKPSKDTSEYKIINIVDVNDGKVNENLNKIYPDNTKYEKYILRDKDLVISSKGTLNKIFVADVKNGEKYIPSGNFTIIRLNQDIINPIYLKLFFESIKGTKIINSIKSGGVLPALNITQLKDLNVPVPSIEEQNKTVSKYLAKIDEIDIIKSKLQKIEIELRDLANEEF